MAVCNRPNLIGRSKEYTQRVVRESYLPGNLQGLAHSLPWPIDLGTPNIHLSCYFAEIPYSDPIASDCSHNGLDIQVSAGTPVSAPERAKVLVIQFDYDRSLADVYLWGEHSRIVYALAHLDPNSLPMNIKKRGRFDAHTETMVDLGETVGSVGRWPFTLKTDVQIPDDVENVYGRQYHHLHFTTKYHQGVLSYRNLSDFYGDVNPLLVLERL